MLDEYTDHTYPLLRVIFSQSDRVLMYFDLRQYGFNTPDLIHHCRVVAESEEEAHKVVKEKCEKEGLEVVAYWHFYQELDRAEQEVLKSLASQKTATIIEGKINERRD